MKMTLRWLRRLSRDVSGLALTEFALSLPFLMIAGFFGTETANFSITTMRVSQLAMHLADNASRVGDTSTLENRKIYESDINDLLLGSNLQGGSRLDFYDHGRAIVSSLQVNDDGEQFIKWQRCKGKVHWASSYGDEGDTVTGMGPAGEQVTADAGDAVIFVEVAYEYQPLITDYFIGDRTITAVSAFNVRDKRDLSQIYQKNSASPDPIADCSTYSSYS